MADRIQQRRDTAARWAKYNPVLLEGEVGYVTDNPNQYKIGDGIHAWNDLPLRGYTGTIVQTTGNDENAVMSQKSILNLTENIKGFNDWNDGLFYPITSIGSTFTGKTNSNIAWKVISIEGVPSNSVIQLCNISIGEKTQGAVVCDMWDKVIDIVNADPYNIIERVYGEPVKLYISTLISNKNSKVIIYDKDKKYELKNNLIDYSKFPFIKQYYDSLNWEVGQIFNPIPSGKNDYYNSFLYLLPSGKTINVYKAVSGTNTPYFIVADATNFEILELLDTNSVKSYTAEKDVYVAFSTNTVGRVNVIDSENTIASNFSNILALKTLTENNINFIADLFRTWKDRNSSLKIEQRTTGFYNGVSGTVNSNENCYLSQAIPVSEGDVFLIFSNANREQYVYFETNSDGTIKVGTGFHANGWVRYGQFKNEFNTYFVKIPKGVEFIGIAWNKADGAYGKVFMSKINSTLLDIIFSNEEILAPYILNNYVTKNRYINLQGGGGYHIAWGLLDFCLIPKDGINSLLFSKSVKSIPINVEHGYILAWYDENYNFISGINSEGFEAYDNFCYPKEIPENAKYFKISILKTTPQYLYSKDTINFFPFVSVKENITWKIGYYIASNGHISSNDGWAITEPIRISNKFNYIISLNFVNGAVSPCYACIYEDKEMTKVVKTFSTGTTTGVSKIYSLLKSESIPTNDGYIVFCTNKKGLTAEDETAVGLELKVDSIFGKSINLSDNVSSEVEEKIPIVVPKYLDIPIGRQTDIFLDGFVAVPNDVKRNPMKITGGLRGETTTIDDNQIRISMSEEKELGVTFSIYDDLGLNNLNNSKTLTLRSIHKNVGNGEDEANICISGDSLIDGTAASCEAYKLLNEDADFIINQIGTRTANFESQQYKHEGRGSWGWETYINPRYETEQYASKTNAFMIDGELNFQKYMQNNFPDLSRKEIDYFIMALGTNDVTQGSSIPNEQRITNIINAAKTFIDALLSEDRGFPNCKIAVGLPGTGAPVFVTTKTSANVFRLAILKLNQAYIDTFDNGKYHPNVTCVMHGAYIDRYDGYQHEDVAVNDYTSRTVRRWTNEVHPLSVGYQQWGRGYYGKLRAFLNNKL